MSDTLKLPEGFELTEEILDEEEKVESVPKDGNLELQETETVEVEEEKPRGLNVLKEKGIITIASL